MRSKTEAACARWLDKNKLKWIYEPEQFKGKGVYTPDFYLPQINTMVEVKPLACISELDRIRPMVEDMNMIFVVLDRASEWEFEIIDMYAQLMPCDSEDTAMDEFDVCWGWMDENGFRWPSFGEIFNEGGFPMFHLGRGCHLRYRLGLNCRCT